MTYFEEQLKDLQLQVNGTRQFLDLLVERIDNLKAEIGNMPPDPEFWAYPSRQKRFTVEPSKALTNPELLPLLNYSSMVGIPYEILQNGNRVYYLETLLSQHEQLLLNAGITIENFNQNG